MAPLAIPTFLYRLQKLAGTEIEKADPNSARLSATVRWGLGIHWGTKKKRTPTPSRWVRLPCKRAPDSNSIGDYGGYFLRNLRNIKRQMYSTPVGQIRSGRTFQKPIPPTPTCLATGADYPPFYPGNSWSDRAKGSENGNPQS